MGSFLLLVKPINDFFYTKFSTFLYIHLKIMIMLSGLYLSDVTDLTLSLVMNQLIWWGRLC
jgi:hypothetical protein